LHEIEYTNHYDHKLLDDLEEQHSPREVDDKAEKNFLLEFHVQYEPEEFPFVYEIYLVYKIFFRLIIHLAWGMLFF
jgi:hypothetical protein